MKHILYLPIWLLTFGYGFSQCPSGAIGVTGAGCGCLGGCDLTSFGGPNCSPSVGGNCTAGYTDMPDVDIVVPATCTYTVTATMMNRPGCTASGADGNCPTCDVLKVDIPGGPKPFQQGASNATLVDSYVLAGPGTIRISGRANRADEIVSYTVTSTGCVNCSPLPIELMEFNAVPRANAVELSWATASESNNDYFTLERSRNGTDFEDYSYMDGQGTTDSPFRYNLVDTSPLEGISYYRLKQTDFDGSVTHSPIKMVLFNPDSDMVISPNPANEGFFLTGSHILESEVHMTDALGRVVEANPQRVGERLYFDAAGISEGVYFVRVVHEGKAEVVKVALRR